MVHLGDIKKIKRAPFVDCITFGSPCQDLSIAGNRAGLSGNRSGLFMDAVRIIREMKEQSGGLYPTFAIWENVPGSFSSNSGKDFQAVLEELARIKEPEVSIPRPENGKWAKSGFIAGNGCSIAWRTLDAQHWGVPQRRRRIALVMDFRGQRAGEILFERTGVSGNPEPRVPAWKGVARNPAHGTAGHDRVVEGAEAYTLKIRSGCEGGGKGPLVQTEKSATLSTLQDQTLFVLQGNMIDRDVQQNGSGIATVRADTHPSGVDYRAQLRWIVRRLTPTECERLQGFPDGWTDIGDWTDSKGKRHKAADSPRYKVLGNSIALPQWWWLTCKMAGYLPEHATLGSLFDGIGGFPLVWETYHGKGTAVWASEIEPFCIAATKKHFGGS